MGRESGEIWTVPGIFAADDPKSDRLLAYDPTPEKDWVSLLTLVSHEALQWCWQDGAKLMVFIHKDKLKEADFSELRCDAG
ncbi:DUF1963 domain-containing protein [Massilia sp. CCM 8734]|nr:DUF1963 domain-containing protein [Massilia sp. CCM 8734]